MKSLSPDLVARDFMTAPPIAVSPDDPARRVAELLIAHRISGMPVVDARGRPVGVVSEADFLDGAAAEREWRRDAWLRILSSGQSVSEDYLAALDRDLGKVSQFMATPAVCVPAEAPAAEVARVMSERRIKRVAVVSDGRIVGVVTRADLMRAVAGLERAATSAVEPTAAQPMAPAPVFPRAAAGTQAPETVEFSAQSMRALVAAHDHAAVDLRRSAIEGDRARHMAEVQELLNAPLTDAEWESIATEARAAAGRGETQCAIMRFPALLCADGGRAVNLPDPSWPSTLRGKAARVYLRWREELQPLGFRLSARIASFPGGLPGDIEMCLVWGRDSG